MSAGRSALWHQIMGAKRERALQHCFGNTQKALDLTRYLNWLVTHFAGERW